MRLFLCSGTLCSGCQKLGIPQEKWGKAVEFKFIEPFHICKLAVNSKQLLLSPLHFANIFSPEIPSGIYSNHVGLLFPLPRVAGITKQAPQSVWLRGFMVKLPDSACRWVSNSIFSAWHFIDWIPFTTITESWNMTRTKKNSDNQSTGYNPGRLLPQWPVRGNESFGVVFPVNRCMSGL